VTSFYEDFLVELKAVDDFLAYRSGDATFVRREDPDVRRLMESIAFFSARTRHAASDQLRRSMLQLARGHLDDFLSPQPSRALIQVVPSGLVDAAVLPAGTRLRLTTSDNELGLFSTMVDVTLRPLQIDFAELQLRGGGGFRLVIRIRARRAVEEIAEPLAIHLSYLNDYQRSLHLQYRLSRHLPDDGVSVFYDQAPDPSRVGAPCGVSFGGAPRAHPEPGAGGCIEQIRTFLHFPAKELVLQVALARARSPWRQAWLCLDLDDGWPRELVIDKAVFRLFVVPIENLVRDAAVPIKCDGTRAHYPIEPARGDARLTLHSVIGVFQDTAAGRDPIPPVHVASGDPSYDLDQVDDGSGAGAPRLVLRLPDAFHAPRLISVEARWHQPWFDSAAQVTTVELQTRHLPGVELRLLGALTPHRPSALWRDPAAMLHVLSRRASRVLQRRDLISLMTLLGADHDSAYAGIDAEVLQIEAYEEPADRHRGGGIRVVYRIKLDEVDDDRLGLVAGYLRCIELLLDAWSANPVRLESPARLARARPLRPTRPTRLIEGGT